MSGAGEVDLIVVGAGAAGIAASRRAAAARLEVRLLEAKDRLGGRAHTERIAPGLLWDRGAHWLHDALHNPLTRLAHELGFAYDRSSRRVLRYTPTGFAGRAYEAELEDYIETASAAIHAAGESGADVAAADVMPRHPRFQAMFESWFAALNGVEPARMSTIDYARAAEGRNWGVIDGYGALIARLGAGLPVELATPALRIGWDGTKVRVRTPRGDLAARAAIVTVSTAVVAAGGIAFEPPLPDRILDALEALPLGEANKVAVAFERNVFGCAEHHFLSFEHATLEAIRFDVRPTGSYRAGHGNEAGTTALAVGYLGGSFARELERAGEPAMAAFALERLADAYGQEIRRSVRVVACTGWCGDRHIGGGYSCARPGRAEARQVLNEWPGERLLFAGEACSIGAYGTVHGAWQSGEAAADRVIRMLRGPAGPA